MTIDVESYINFEIIVENGSINCYCNNNTTEYGYSSDDINIENENNIIFNHNDEEICKLLEINWCILIDKNKNNYFIIYPIEVYNGFYNPKIVYINNVK